MKVSKADDFSRANSLYQSKNYTSALKLYRVIESANEGSSSIYYNIGNCYYKLDSIGKAILYYERALKLNPDDDDINFNLKIASLKTVDKIETVEGIFYARWIRTISSLFGIGQWSVIMIIMIWITFISWGFYVYSQRVVRKKITFILSTLFVLCSLCCFLLLNQNYRNQFIKQNAIVMTSSSYAKSSPDEHGNDQFILHEGTKVEVLDELDGWKKIRIANGSVGWLKGDEIEII
jgi:tetratricopeptide (TPR) repeat protein